MPEELLVDNWTPLITAAAAIAGTLVGTFAALTTERRKLKQHNIERSREDGKRALLAFLAHTRVLIQLADHRHQGSVDQTVLAEEVSILWLRQAEVEMFCGPSVRTAVHDHTLLLQDLAYHRKSEEPHVSIGRSRYAVLKAAREEFALTPATTDPA